MAAQRMASRKPFDSQCCATGQSVITDLEQGSFAQKRRVVGLPLMHRMWFHPEGYSLGYTKKQKIGNPSELYFLDPEARLLLQR